ncbi:MAG: efflux RND transporter permease subunit [Hyphomicrobiaceae bacterium]|nr:efflux RND transporter permease subunit [Hyphomicrobiaceae bacterium]
MIRWFAAHPTAANLLFLLIVAAGLFAAPTLKRETFPDYQAKQVEVEVAYRGATAADVEDAVCRRLIEVLKGIENLAELTCVAQDNRASAIAEMRAGGNVSRFLDDIQTEVAAIDDLPPNAETPVVRELHRTDLVAAVAIAGPMSAGDLKAYAKDLQDRMLALPGVSRVDLKGFSQRQFQIEASKDVLRQYGLTASQLTRLVAQQSVDLPAGTVETREQDILIRFTDERRSVGALSGLVVLAGETGGELRLGQIATIRDGFEKTEDKITFNGQRAAVLEVHKARAQDALVVLELIKSLIETEKAQLPETVTLVIAQDMTSIVRDRLQMLVENGFVGLALVILVMSLFFRPRIAVWAAMGLPVAFLGAFAAMALLGLTINMMTLVALLMAIGIVMDDSIVIADSIAEEARRTGSSLEAAVAGTRRVLPGVLSSFLTTVAVFAPLSFLSGELGAVLEVLPVVLIAALAASLTEAFWILPHHLRHPVEHSRVATPSRLRHRFDRGFAWVRDSVVGTAADLAIRHRYGVAGVFLIALLASAGYVGGGYIGREAMPEIDGDVLEARILMPQGTPLGATESVVAQVTSAIQRVDGAFAPRQPAGEPLVKAVQVRFNENATAGEAGPHVATVTVDLLSAEKRMATLDEVVERWRAEIGEVPGLISLIIQEPGLGPQGIPIEIRITSGDLDVAERAAHDLARSLETYTGAYNVLHDLRPGKPEVRLSLADGAHTLGLTAEEVAGQLRSAFLGSIAANLQIGAESYEVQVRHAVQDRDDLGDVADFTIMLADGRQVPLGTIANIERGRGWAKITRIDGERTVTVEANVDGRKGNAQAIVSHVEATVLPELARRYPEVGFEIRGQAARSEQTAASIRRGFLIGVIGIFVVLSFQFRSYIEPLVVMTAIPLAFLGALWGHVLMGYAISMPSLVGAASLAGIVVNNSILMVQFIKSHTAAGLDIATAAGQASRDRFRAIFVSASTTIAGILPLLAETSTQAQVLKPLVISVGFGLLASTVLVLVAVPSLYAILDDFGVTRRSDRLNPQVWSKAYAEEVQP